MLSVVVRKLASLTISLMVMVVPREKYEKELAELPTIPERVAGIDLGGWELRGAPSERTGTTHYYFYYPASSPGAPTLVCLHGFNTDGRVFGNLKPLSDAYNLIAYNFPEESHLYNGTIGDFVVVLDDFLLSVGLDTVSILGNSVGGGVAVAYAARTEQTEVSELMLVSTSIFGGTEEDKKRSRGMADKLLGYPDYKLYYLLEKGKSILNRLQKTELGQSAPVDIVVTKRIGWYRQIMKALYDYDGTVDARKLTCPVLVIHGADDRVLSLEAAQAIPCVIPQARLVTVAGGSHSLAYSDASSVVAYTRAFHAGNPAKVVAASVPRSSSRAWSNAQAYRIETIRREKRESRPKTIASPVVDGDPGACRLSTFLPSVFTTVADRSVKARSFPGRRSSPLRSTVAAFTVNTESNQNMIRFIWSNGTRKCSSELV